MQILHYQTEVQIEVNYYH